MNEEAAQEAERFWRRVLTKCGDSYYAKSFVEGDQDRLSPSMQGYWIYQIKGFSITTRGQEPERRQLTEAEILNGARPARPGEGLEWSGTTTLSVRVARTGKHEHGSREGKVWWNKWADNDRIIVNVKKTDGRWDFYRLAGFGQGPRQLLSPINCDELKAAEQIVHEEENEKKNAEFGSTPFTDSKGWFQLPGRYAGWYSLGKGPITISFHEGGGGGAIYLDTARFAVGIGGISRRAPDGALAPGLPFGALIVKVGKYGTPQTVYEPGHFDIAFATEDEVFIAANDTDYSDNSGSFEMRISHCIKMFSFPRGKVTPSMRCENRRGSTAQSNSNATITNSLDDLIVVHFHGALGSKSNCSGPMRVSPSGMTYNATQWSDGQKHVFVFTFADMGRFQFARPFNPNVDNQLNVVIQGRNQTFITIGGVGTGASAGFEKLQQEMVRFCKNRP